MSHALYSPCAKGYNSPNTSNVTGEVAPCSATRLYYAFGTESARCPDTICAKNSHNSLILALAYRLLYPYILYRFPKHTLLFLVL